MRRGNPTGMSQEVRINGFTHVLKNGLYWGYNPLILAIDPITSCPGSTEISRVGALGVDHQKQVQMSHVQNPVDIP